MPASPAPVERPANTPARGLHTQSSRLLPALFGQLSPPRLRVFEAGPANPETIRFFSQMPSRIHVCDLYSEALIREHQGELSEQELKREFQNILGFKVGTLIDICLFWDVLNYMSRPALRAFSAALQPYVHAGTRAHGFSVLNVKTPLRNQQYGIVDESSISVRPGRSKQLDYYPHSHEELNHCLSCFDVGRGWLLPDGRLEILLEAVVG